MFTKNDVSQIKKHKLTVKNMEQQLRNFEEGFPYLELVKPAVPGDGIIQVGEEDKKKIIENFEKQQNSVRMLKFVPASGAATRMFKDLYDLLNNYKGTEQEYLELIKEHKFPSIYYFFEHLYEFAFYNDLIEKLKEKGNSIENITKNHDFIEVLKTILYEDGLNYGNLPKGLLKFHKCKEEERTPVEEHIIEAIHYAQQKNMVRLHFTVSPEHKSLFKSLVKDLKKKYEKNFNVKLDIDFSEQSPSTDTIAVNMDNTPFRDSQGNLVFRPGGHGALIYNLDDIDADLVFIKNIDNVSHDRLKSDTYTYKKLLAGILMNYQSRIFEYVKMLKKGKLNAGQIEEMANYLQKELFVLLPENFVSLDLAAKTKYLLAKFDRPIRVCGMVRNEGEPGGGPYWAKNNDGSISLQIVESSQFNPGSVEQKKLIAKSTHFNPVDLICGVRNYKGRRFQLYRYVDSNTGFISKKSKDGKDLKALELPGLWNGAMSDWNTIFVEVPISTFNPVKTIYDLLRNEHLHETQLLADDNKPANILI